MLGPDGYREISLGSQCVTRIDVYQGSEEPLVLWLHPPGHSSDGRLSTEQGVSIRNATETVRLARMHSGSEGRALTSFQLEEDNNYEPSEYRDSLSSLEFSSGRSDRTIEASISPTGIWEWETLSPFDDRRSRSDESGMSSESELIEFDESLLDFLNVNDY